MASFIKVKTEKDVRMLIKHNNRERCCLTNQDIDESRSKNNYSFLPEGTDCYERFKRRKGELYFRKNNNMVNAIACCISAPKDLDESLYSDFFFYCNEYLNLLLGTANCISSVVHFDESHPHLHYMAIPATYDAKMHKSGGEKISAKAVMNRQMLCRFHPELQKYLHDHGIDANVINGATKSGNRTVRQLKEQRTYKQEYEISRW